MSFSSDEPLPAAKKVFADSAVDWNCNPKRLLTS